jgi:hypothetical protein
MIGHFRARPFPFLPFAPLFDAPGVPGVTTSAQSQGNRQTGGATDAITLAGVAPLATYLAPHDAVVRDAVDAARYTPDVHTIAKAVGSDVARGTRPDGGPGPRCPSTGSGLRQPIHHVRPAHRHDRMTASNVF